MAFSSDKRFVCIEHPAKIENVEKILQTLGGIEKVSATYSKPSHRMELYFRPNDPFCKPVFGDRQNTTNLLLKVKQKKAPDGSISFDSEILGLVTTTYKFQSMVDFQYLPMQKQEDNTFKAIGNELLPTKLQNLDWLKQESALFILPPIFTRLDNPVEYFYRRDPSQRKDEDPNAQLQFVSQCLRHRRIGFAKNLAFEAPETPNTPSDEAMNRFKSKGCKEDLLRSAKALFTKRPIWHKNAVAFELKVGKEKMKWVLPVVAYTFLSGPWRSLWVRLGYDPRQDPTSKIYQSLDFRVRQTAARNIPINSKRSAYSYVLPNKISQVGGRVPMIRTDSDAGRASSSKDEWTQLELTYTFYPTVCPPFRQLFYQFCDIHEPEVQQLLAQCPQQPTCHERYGWLDAKTYEECRNVLVKIVQELCKETEKGQDEFIDDADAMDCD